VISDVKTVRNNCGKYNGTGDDLWILADKMYDEFLAKLKETLSELAVPTENIVKLDDENFLHACSVNARALSNRVPTSTESYHRNQSRELTSSAGGGRSSTRIRLRMNNTGSSSQNDRENSVITRRSHRLNRSPTESNQHETLRDDSIGTSTRRSNRLNNTQVEDSQNKVGGDDNSSSATQRSHETNSTSQEDNSHSKTEADEDAVAATRRSRRSTRSQAYPMDDGVSEEEEADEAHAPQARRSLRWARSQPAEQNTVVASRQSLRNKSAAHSNEVEVNDEDSEESASPAADTSTRSGRHKRPSVLETAAESEKERPSNRKQTPSKCHESPRRQSQRSRNSISYEEPVSDACQDSESTGNDDARNQSRSNRKAPQQKPTKSSVRGSRSKKGISYLELESDADEADIESGNTTSKQESRRQTNRSARATSAELPKRTSLRSKSKFSDDTQVEGVIESKKRAGTKRRTQEHASTKSADVRAKASPIRHSRRPQRRIKSSYQDIASDDGESESEVYEEEESEEEEQVVEPTAKKRRINRTPNNSVSPQKRGNAKKPARRKPVSRGRKKKADESEESDEEESDEESSSSNDSLAEENQVTTRRGRSAGLPLKVAAPSLEDWPSIAPKHITKVTIEVLKAMRQLDDQGVFYTPVLEALPHLKKEYCRKVERPMDFGTIEEVEMHRYEDISELQHDLQLVFQNCVAFNGVKSDYAQYAIRIWEQINDVFENVCKRLKI